MAGGIFWRWREVGAIANAAIAVLFFAMGQPGMALMAAVTSAICVLSIISRED